jgi:hypothetical protein
VSFDLSRKIIFDFHECTRRFDETDDNALLMLSLKKKTRPETTLQPPSRCTTRCSVSVAMEPGTYVRPHRHSDRNVEVLVILRGSVLIFRRKGKVLERTVLKRRSNNGLSFPEYLARRFRGPGTAVFESSRTVQAHREDQPRNGSGGRTAEALIFLEWYRNGRRALPRKESMTFGPDNNADGIQFTVSFIRAVNSFYDILSYILIICSKSFINR